MSKFTSHEFHVFLRIQKGPSSFVKRRSTTAIFTGGEVCFTLQRNWVCKRYITNIHAPDINIVSRDVVSNCGKLCKFKIRFCCIRAITRSVTLWFRPRIVELIFCSGFLRFNTANCQYIVASQAVTIIIALLTSVTAPTRQHIIISMVLKLGALVPRRRVL